jgi:hypothetical protein
VSRGSALLGGGLLGGLLAVALMAPASAAACPSDGVCTDSGGKYTLTVPPLSGTPFAEEASCEWKKVHVEFGDGTSQNYEFNGEVGISKEHTFPHYGKFRVEIAISEGHRTDTNPKPCYEGPLPSANVYFQSPQEIAAEEAQIKAEKEAKEKKEAEKKAAEEAKKQKEREEREAREQAAREKFSGSGNSGSEGSSGGGQGGPATFWQSCRGKILVHGVGCPKARKVIGRARRRDLIDEGTQDILGFSCHVTGTLPARIACRRGKSRMLAPL